MACFEDILPRLLAAYECGRLVPFIGSGMSIPAAVSWTELVNNLENQADIKPPAVGASSIPTADLIRRANAAVRKLKSGERGAFFRAVKAATLKSQEGFSETIPQTQILASLYWPLVLTTNYDNLYEDALAKHFPEESQYAPIYSVVGRSPQDCQRVLNSLSVAGRALIWALQGYFDAPGTRSRNPALHEQLVIGHEQYRRVTYRDIHFRRAFAEVFRQRSLLFLGSGLKETYLQELFGEVLELYGPSTRPHYALISADGIDPEFMLSRFQITVVTYPKGQHQAVFTNLMRLREEIEKASKKQLGWIWGGTAQHDGGRGAPELEVVCGRLPERPPLDKHGEPDREHCLAVSAGGGERFFFSPGIKEILKCWGVAEEEQPEQRSKYVGYYPGRHVYAVRARSKSDQRALAYVYMSALELFQDAGPKYLYIHMQLLAAGGADKLNREPDAEWVVRPFPTRFSFVQIVSAYAEWRRQYAGQTGKLIIHVVDSFVARELASGRIDVVELLNCSDVRFWVEVVLDSGEIERRLFQSVPTETLGDIVEAMNLTSDYWSFEVTPPPILEKPEDLIQPVNSSLAESLRNIGVVPGSTLHFRRLSAPNMCV